MPNQFYFLYYSKFRRINGARLKKEFSQQFNRRHNSDWNWLFISIVQSGPSPAYRHNVAHVSDHRGNRHHSGREQKKEKRFCCKLRYFFLVFKIKIRKTFFNGPDLLPGRTGTSAKKDRTKHNLFYGLFFIGWLAFDFAGLYGGLFTARFEFPGFGLSGLSPHYHN